ncbi:MAG: outer membrane protein transport protein, partial [Myxococcales bacterium]|nr:outer membrane protein transport protein [Myxococcales bacterium]
MMRDHLVFAVMVAIAAPAASQANPMDVFGFGARGMAMGNAATAVADDGSANYYNPAGLALADDLQINIGYLRTFTNLRLNERDMEVDENNGIMASVNIPGDIGPVRLAFGLGLFLPDARVSRVRALPQYQPRFVMLDNRTQRIFISANLAVRPIPELTIGGGLSFVTHMAGGVAVDGTLFPEPERALLRTAVDVDFKTVRAPAAGVTVTPLPWLRLGVVYRGEVKVQLDVEAAVSGEIKELLGTQTLAGSFQVSSFNTNLFSPQQVFFGAAFWPLPETTLSLDLGW